jgi:hypothetical protein
MDQREPSPRRVRPTAVPVPRAATPLLLLVLLVLAGCGAAEDPPAPGSEAGSRSPSALRCRGRVVGVPAADLDGDGRADGVRLTTGGGCGDEVVATVDRRLTRVRVPGGLASVRVTVVHRAGGRPDLLMVAGRTTRSGQQQPRLYGVHAGVLAEVTVAGEPWLPLLDATRGAAPREASCATGGRVVVLTAQASRPPGIVLAWDLTRTTYDVRGAEAVVAGRRVVGRSLADPVLRRQRPGLYDGRLFTRCR